MHEKLALFGLVLWEQRGFLLASCHVLLASYPKTLVSPLDTNQKHKSEDVTRQRNHGTKRGPGHQRGVAGRRSRRPWMKPVRRLKRFGWGGRSALPTRTGNMEAPPFGERGCSEAASFRGVGGPNRFANMEAHRSLSVRRPLGGSACFTKPRCRGGQRGRPAGAESHNFRLVQLARILRLWF